MRMLWKCIVSASKHWEVDRQRSSTQDLFNTIICLAEHPWITGLCCTSAHFTFQAAADRCDRRPGAQASHYDENNHHVSNDCMWAPRFHEICDVILTCTGGSSGQWVSEMGKLKIEWQNFIYNINITNYWITVYVIFRPHLATLQHVVCCS